MERPERDADRGDRGLRITQHLVAERHAAGVQAVAHEKHGGAEFLQGRAGVVGVKGGDALREGERVEEVVVIGVVGDGDPVGAVRPGADHPQREGGGGDGGEAEDPRAHGVIMRRRAGLRRARDGCGAAGS